MHAILLEIVLETSDDAFLVPAHIWTPWFSMLGSKSGFDSIEACFDDLSPLYFCRRDRSFIGSIHELASN
jgi:PHP family Zn ribbon phosphoesterase